MTELHGLGIVEATSMQEYQMALLFEVGVTVTPAWLQPLALFPAKAAFAGKVIVPPLVLFPVNSSLIATPNVLQFATPVKVAVKVVDDVLGATAPNIFPNVPAPVDCTVPSGVIVQPLAAKEIADTVPVEGAQVKVKAIASPTEDGAQLKVGVALPPVTSVN